MKNNNFTPRAHRLLKGVYDLAEKLEHSKITRLHVFLSFLEGEFNQILEAFNRSNIDVEQVKSDANNVLNAMYNNMHFEENSGDIEFTESVSELFEQDCLGIASQFKHDYIGLEHVFLALFFAPDKFLDAFVNSQKYDFDLILGFFIDVLSKEDVFVNKEQNSVDTSLNGMVRFNPEKYTTLNQYATNLNFLEAEKEDGSLYVDKKLVQKLSEILCRKNKSNPIIVGEAGVGKTALVEALAKAIVDGEVSDFIAMKSIYNLDVVSMIAGCKLRGEFEEKLKTIIKEIEGDPFVILFIDEIHTIIGAGNNENGMDVANILKPYLANGKIVCIGATTFDEYNRTIAKDPALSRRFQMIKMEEPNRQQAFELIKNIKKSYEGFHFIEFSDEMIFFAIDMAMKHIRGHLPDKALDLIDQVGAKVKLKNFIKTKKMIEIERRISKATENCENIDAVMQKVMSDMSEYQKLVENRIKKWKENRYKVQKNDILQVVADKTNIPMADLVRNDGQKIKKLKLHLEKEVLGQSGPIDQIYKCLIRAKAGFRDDKKPIASLLFAGPSGVGKTMTAKEIAGKLFLNKNNFINFDLSEYADQISVNKLIGASPGYIGYEKGGILTEQVKRNPHCLILFDEIQKAHEDVLSTLQQILEEGKLSDSSGDTVDFSNAIIIMTTNVGAKIDATEIGFGSKTQKAFGRESLEIIKKTFSPDLLNRLDEIVVFNKLTEKDIKDIITKELIKTKEELKNKNIKINSIAHLVGYIFKSIQFSDFGARQVTRTIQKEIQSLVAEKLIEKEDSVQLKICVKKGQVCVI
jgi:ATP-dependent Clp protease ATP-binding subunit ClpC